MSVCGRGPGGDGGIFELGPLDAPDAVEEAARQHFERLSEHVLGGLLVNLGAADPHAPHGFAITELTLSAGSGVENHKSVCFGLVYAFLTRDWDRSGGHEYWSYLALLKTLDSDDVLVRTLVAFGRRCRAMREPCRRRLFPLLSDLVAARWPEVEKAVLALQRSACPGAAWPGCGGVVAPLLRLLLDSVPLLAADNNAVRLSFLWAVRWVCALQAPDCAAELKKDAPALKRDMRALALALWKRAPEEQVLRAGPVLFCAMLHLSGDQELAACYRRVTERLGLGDLMASQPCLDHLITAEEQEQLAFLLGAGAKNEYRAVQWFVDRHVAGATDTHIADLCLWALTMAEAAAEPPGLRQLWEQLLSLAGPQTLLAFAFVARQPGYAQRALVAAVATSAHAVDVRARILEAAEAHFPRSVDQLSRELRARR